MSKISFTRKALDEAKKRRDKEPITKIYACARIAHPDTLEVIDGPLGGAS